MNAVIVKLKAILLQYITGFMIHGATAVAIVPELKTFDKGLIFVKDTEILLCGDKWTIVVNIALDDYSNMADLMKSMLNHIRQKVQTQKNPKAYTFDIHWEEIDQCGLKCTHCRVV